MLAATSSLTSAGSASATDGLYHALSDGEAKERGREHAKAHGGKSWAYLLIPHDVVADNKTLAGLAAAHSFSAAPQSKVERPAAKSPAKKR